MSTTIPGAQVQSLVFSGFTGGPVQVTVTDKLNYKRPQVARTRKEDAHTVRNVHTAKHITGMFSCTLLTDRDLAVLDNIVNAVAQATLLNGRILTFTNVTLSMADGIEEDTTEGQTSAAVEFSFDTVTDRQ